MRNLILFFFVTIVSLSACKKSDIEKPADPPVPGAPSSTFALDYMEVEENLFGAYLYLYGNFGDSSASSKIKISNTIVTGDVDPEGFIASWTPWMIKVSIGDPDDNTGAGYVSVFNGGKETNKRMLNVWELSLYYTQPDEGTILKEVRFNTFLRADAGTHRNILTLNMPSSFSSRSEAHWAIGGQGHASYTGGGMTISLADRAGTVTWDRPYEDNNSKEQNFQSKINFKDGMFHMSELRMHKNKATKYSYLADASPAPYITDYDFLVEVVPLNDVWEFELDENKAIKAGSYITGPHGTQYDFTWDGTEALNHMHNFTLQWEKTNPRFNL